MDLQGSLFTADACVGVDRTFAGLVRHKLDAHAWVDEVPGWVAGADALFETIYELAPWESHERWMFDKRVVEPRLTTAWRHLDVPVIDDMRAALSERYGVDFDRGGLNLYRDGNDSVAWHRDRIAKEIVDPLVAIVTLGEGRDFLMRRRGGGSSTKFRPTAGHLIVTGGSSQRDWEHSVPKRRSAAPRISMTFRHG